VPAITTVTINLTLANHAVTTTHQLCLYACIPIGIYDLSSPKRGIASLALEAHTYTITLVVFLF